MPDSAKRWELALDQPGSARPAAARRAAGFGALIALLGVAVVAFGAIQLPAFPQFATFHAGVVFLMDAITAFLMLVQFRYRRQLCYLVLGGAFLFNAAVMVPFLLTFPGALQAAGPMFGGQQSSIWVWHVWHILFPAMVIASLLADGRFAERCLPGNCVLRSIAVATIVALAVAAATGMAVTAFQDSLPVMIDGARHPMTDTFYLVGGLAAVAAAAAALLAWIRGWRSRTTLYLWLAVAMTAFVADAAASLAANGRYTVGWYLGRVESMIAGSVLLLVFLAELNRLYQQLAVSMTDLSAANDRLVATLAEKETLVAELRRSEEQIRELAYYDPLTGLPNRRLLMDRLYLALAQARRHHYSMAIMFLDLDRFKQVNDSLGHAAGDELLRQVSSRLTACMRGGDTVARSGGDEFVVVLPEIAHPEDAALVAEKIFAALKEPVAIANHSLRVTTSIGIAIYPVDGDDDLQDLMRKADTAMYAVKEAGRNGYRFYGDMAIPAAVK
ncbi:MAG TPA: GGDEF domain-containing protein [Rhodocyclaceae bacterium]|nr:GGDEF domain-containing protein [Rhodocyclaceae bacterium]